MIKKYFRQKNLVKKLAKHWWIMQKLDLNIVFLSKTPIFSKKNFKNSDYNINSWYVYICMTITLIGNIGKEFSILGELFKRWTKLNNKSYNKHIRKLV
jgi:hypothetical protein